jgi:transposase-like protein
MFTKKAHDKPSHNGHSTPHIMAEARIPRSSADGSLVRYSLDTKLRARNEFICGKGSLREISKRHGIKFMTIRSWSSDEKWLLKRTKFVAAAKARFDAAAELPAIAPPIVTPTQSAASELDAQRIMIARAIREAKSGRELRDLAMAQKLVLDSWSLVTGHPRPGTRRQSKRGSAAGPPAPFEPLEPETPSETPACGVDGQSSG